MRLFHYTCRYRARQITRYGTLRPNPQPALAGLPLIWLTDADQPTRDGLGLTNELRGRHGDELCDRLAVRYVVDTDEAMAWLDPRIRPDLQRLLLKTGAFAHFESFGDPARWFIALRALPCRQDMAYRQPSELVLA